MAAFLVPTAEYCQGQKQLMWGGLHSDRQFRWYSLPSWGRHHGEGQEGPGYGCRNVSHGPPGSSKRTGREAHGSGTTLQTMIHTLITLPPPK